MQYQHHSTMQPIDPPSYQSHSFGMPYYSDRSYVAIPSSINMFIHSGRENDAVSTPDDMSSSDSAFLQRATTWIPRAPRIPQGMLPVLQRPVVIPRLDANRLLRTPLPFIRAYSPELRSLDIHERDFVAFIDNLTVAQAPPVPLQALDAAGLAVSMVPHHWMAIAGFSMNVVAGVGTAAMTKTRTCQFLEIVNQKYFGPRGLKSAIYEDEQLVKRLRLDPHMPPLAPPGNNTMPVTVGYRRIEALKPYTASLTFHVPPPIEQRDALDEMAAKQIQRKIKRREDGGHNPEPSTAKQEKRLEKEQKVVARMEYIVVESLNSTGY